jgi:hypothetical protein
MGHHTGEAYPYLYRPFYFQPSLAFGDEMATEVFHIPAFGQLDPTQ